MANDINLAALWVPVMPETRELAPKMKEAGEQAKKAFAEGFSGSSGGAAGPEQMGQQFAQQFSRSFTSTFEGLPIPKTMKEFMGSLGEEAKLTETQLNRLKSTATTAFNEMKTAQDAAAKSQAELTRLTEYYNQKVSEGKGAQYAGTLQMIRVEQDKLTAATTLGVQKQTEHAEAMAKVNGATEQAVGGSRLMSAAIGGLAGAFATLGIEVVTKGFELLAEGMKKVVETGVEVVKFTVEAGEAFENMEHQITLFSTASGEAFDELSVSAEKVFRSIDSSGQDVGKTMATLASRLGMEAGPALEQLTTHVIELGDRFGKLDPASVAAGFVQMHVEADQADASLGSLLQSSRETGTDFAQNVEGMKTLSATLHELGMSYEQGGHFIAELNEHGLTATTMLTALDHSQAEFSKRGLTFADGMKLAAKSIQDYRDAGNDAMADDVAQKLFGRRWTDAISIIQSFQDTMSATPGSFAGTSESIDKVVEDTETLADKWQNFKNNMMADIAPIGKVILDVLGGALEQVKGYLDTNHDSMVEKIRDIGHSFIDTLPDIKQFAEDFLRMIGGLVNPLMTLTNVVAKFFIGLGQLKAMVTGDYKLFDALQGITDKMDALTDKDLGKVFNDAADGIHGMSINTEDLNLELDHLLDKQLPAAPVLAGPGAVIPNLAIPPGAPLIGNLPGTTPPTPGSPFLGPALASPGAPQLPSKSLPPLPTLPKPGPFDQGNDVPLPGFPAHPASDHRTVTADVQPAAYSIPMSPADMQGNSPDQLKQLARSMFPWVDSEWPYFEWLIGKESSWTLGQVSSAGATGLGQFMPATWANYGMPGGSTDPATQLQLAMQYIYNRYGTPSAAVAQYYNHPGGEGSYSTGGSVRSDPMSMMSALLGGPRGNDTVPAWLDPREFVVNPEASMRFGPLLHFINAKGMQGGGHGSSDYVQSGAGNDRPDLEDPQLQAITQYANQMGLTLTAGKAGHGTHDVGSGYHDSGEAGDFSDGVSEPSDAKLAFAQAMFSHFGSELSELIYNDPRMPQLIKDGKAVDPQAVYGPWLPGHRDHVHVAIKATQTLSDIMSPGSDPIVQGGPGGLPAVSLGGQYSSARGGAQFPGMPGQYGGAGAYGGEKEDTRIRDEAAVRDARQRADDMDQDIKDKQAAIGDLQKKADDLRSGAADTILHQPADAETQKKADKALADAKVDLAKAVRERGDQDTNILLAERKSQEDALAVPAGAKEKRDTKTEGQFSSLATGLMKGIAQEFGLGDVFGKPPWEWGIVKMLGGMANWGIGTANAWADQIGAGKTGIGGPGWGNNSGQPMPGYNDSGSGPNIMGIQLPNVLGRNNNSNVSTGPNVTQNTVPSAGYGAPLGPNPGPTVDNSMNITMSGVPVDKTVEQVQGVQNAKNGAVVNTPALPQPAG